MRRDRRWKVVLCLDDEVGELYDVEADPGESRNLWHERTLRAMRDELSAACLRWLARGALNANRPASRAPQQAMRI